MRLFGGARSPRLKHIQVVANTASGSVGPNAPELVREILAEYELTDLLRKISQTWQKPLARERGAAGGTSPVTGVSAGTV